MTAHSKNMSPHSHDAFEKPTQSDSTVGNYLIFEKIGQGSFATVYKAQHKVSGHFVAIKSVLRSKLTKKLLENLESEISILKAIRHDHIVGLSECLKTDTHIYLIMDYCAMGDLSQYIKEIRNNNDTKGPLGGLPENTLRHFLHQLASALRFLRSRNLVHRDIKPQNLLLVSPQKSSSSELPTLQVADFGFARFLPNASMADTLCGSPLYMGPEILSYKKYDAKADLWSVGAVLYEMMTGRPPFRAQNHLELLKNIEENNDVIRFPDDKWAARRTPLMGDDLKDLIRKLLKKDPVERLSFEEFFTHPAVLSSTTSSNTSNHTMETSTTPPQPIPANQRRDLPTHYEPLPFAQSSTSQQHSRRRSHVSTETQNKYHRNTREENVSPVHSRGRSGKMGGHNELPESNPTVKRTARQPEDEELLHGYVVLDTRSVATNQFADEINGAPHNNNENYRLSRRQSVEQLAIQRRKSSSSSSSSAASSATNQTGYPPSSTSPITPPFVASREKRISTGAPGFLFTKALAIATDRLFGTGHSPPNYNKLQQTMIGSPRGFLMMGAGPRNPDAQGSPYCADPSGSDQESVDEDNKAMVMIEKVACMGHAVAKFADSKFDLLVNGGGGGGLIGVTNESTLAAEALVLHLKALALLEIGFEMAKEYWHQRRRGSSDTEQQHWRHDRQQHETPSPRPSATRLNDAVQWMRERFNECLDRASIEKSKCESATEPSHDSSSGNSPCVEKLLYDKALEMSRAAAVHELTGENIVDCEQDYRTAIWMLEAILEVGDDKDMAIEEDDRKIINKFIDSIQHRISVLQRKLLDQKEQQYPNSDIGNNKYGTHQAILSEER